MMGELVQSRVQSFVRRCKGNKMKMCRWQVTRRNLEQLRAIKTRMVRLFTKVETIRELLERLLNDDDDMRDMNLSARCAVPRSRAVRMRMDVTISVIRASL
jgi:magnesium transporter